MSKRPERRPGSDLLPRGQGPNPSPVARLVGVGFRLWLTGYKTCDLDSWHTATQLYHTVLGPAGAQTVIPELSCWVRTVARSAAREIEINPPSCPGFCKDECLAIAMIAACQHKTCPAMRACAFALIENSSIEPVVARSESFAMTLIAVGQVLTQDHIVNVTAFSEPQVTGYIQ